MTNYKKLSCLGLGVMAFFMWVGSLSGSVALVENGEPSATVVVLAEENEGRFGDSVADFVYHIEKMSGATLPVVEVESAEASPPSGNLLVVGSLAGELGLEVPESPFSNVTVIEVSGNRVLAGGGNVDARVAALYTILRDLGCDWVMPGEIGEIIPEAATVRLAEGRSEYTPGFPYRRLWYRGNVRLASAEDREEFAVWQRRQRMTTYDRFLFGDGHLWGGLINRYRDRFEENPEMLALVRTPTGELERRGPQLETTNPDVIALIVEHIRNQFERNNWANDHEVALTIGPADGLNYSISTETQLASSGKIDPIVGEPDTTDLLVLMANTIIEEVGEEFPNLTLGFYSYSTHADFPQRYHPTPRLNQTFAPINFSRFHSVFDDNVKSVGFYREVVDLWGQLNREQGNKLSYRGYNWNLAENMLPYSMLKIMGEELPWYYENGITGINVEATKAWSINGPHDYLLAVMTWDPTLDWRDVLRDYSDAAFGAGARPMEQYFLNLTERQHSMGMEAGSYHAMHLIYDQEFVEQSKALIQRAMELAETNGDRERASFVLASVIALELYLQYFEAAGSFDFPLIQARYQAMLDHWEATHAINSQLVAGEVPQYLRRFILSFVDLGLKYSTGDYRIVEPLPEALPTMLDPNHAGDVLNFMGPKLNDRFLLRTHTWSMPWDAQGLGSYRDGAVWYRHHFEWPEDLPTEGAGLFLGGFEDEAVVYLNGSFVGRSGRAFSRAVPFDLSDDIQPGSNLLAVQIIRHSKANELGLGGLIRPSYIFHGPRLEQKAPRFEQNYRVLPGGEIEMINR